MTNSSLSASSCPFIIRVLITGIRIRFIWRRLCPLLYHLGQRLLLSFLSITVVTVTLWLGDMISSSVDEESFKAVLLRHLLSFLHEPVSSFPLIALHCLPFLFMFLLLPLYACKLALAEPQLGLPCVGSSNTLEWHYERVAFMVGKEGRTIYRLQKGISLL